jgi:Zn-dependent protease with chaperone function
MSRGLVAFVVACAIFCATSFACCVAWAQLDPAFEAKLRDRLAASHPDAVSIWEQANQARERRDLQTAIVLYGQVIAAAPEFDAAYRRLCSVQADTHAIDDAVASCRHALLLDRSPENFSALALALTSGDPPIAVDVGDDAAKAMATAAELDPDDPEVREAGCQVMLRLERWDRLAVWAHEFERVAPQSPQAWSYGAVAAMAEQRWDDADDAIAHAKAAGATPDQIARLQSLRNTAKREADAHQTFFQRWGSKLLALAAVLFGAMALLFALGSILSAITLRAMRRAVRTSRPTREDAQPTTGERVLRRTYAAVLWISCAYFYLSIPLLAVGVVGATAAVFYLFVAIGVGAPIHIVVIVGGGGVITIYAIVKALLSRRGEAEPGDRIEKGAHPKLDAVLAEVAKKVGTAPVDVVYLTPGTDIAVLERGGLSAQLRGSTERALVLGAGVLDGMSLRAFKSIVAHEYGHFRVGDTAGGGFALAVRRSLMLTTLHLVQARADHFLNPAWWYVNAFVRVFLRISQGASRMQEQLADRWAAHAYGSASFVEGMCHVIDRSARFEAHLGATLADARARKLPISNLYTHAPSKEPNESAIEERISMEMEKPASPYDSHPSPGERIAAIEALTLEGEPPREDDDDEAWSLFEDREAIEEEMTDLVRTRLRARGIDIAESKVA